jgi:hypothetical protein
MRKYILKYLASCVFLFPFFFSCEEDSDTTTEDTTQASNSTYYASTLEEALAANCPNHEADSDYAWNDADVVSIKLNGNLISVSGTGATADGSMVTITAGGTYSIDGVLSDGQIMVNTKDDGIVRLIFNGIDITNTSSAPVYVKKAEKVIIVLADGTENHVKDGTAYVFENADDNEPNAAVFSKDDLTVCGNGSLAVEGNYNDGITSKDGLIIKSGTIQVKTADDGIRGKDYLIIRNGNIKIDAGGDGLKSDEEEDVIKGYIAVDAGTISIISGGDAMSAKTDVLIRHGTFDLSSGGGSHARIDESLSAKGIKALVNLIIDSGSFALNSADDAFHSHGTLIINGGTYDIATGDDGMHSESEIGIKGGDILISECYEGIESAAYITLSDGNIIVTSSDDGLNIPLAGGSETGPPGQVNNTGSANGRLYIKGGTIVMNASGDGIDISGSVEMTGGTLLVNGPTRNDNGALDYDGTFMISGGLLIAAGSSGMAQAPGTTSTQNSLLLNYSSSQQAGILIHIQSADGTGILTFAPSKNYQSLAFSSPVLATGMTYSVYSGGSCTGTANNGLYQQGTYTPGSVYTSFTVTGTVTKVGSQQNHPPGGP